MNIWWVKILTAVAGGSIGAYVVSPPCQVIVYTVQDDGDDPFLASLALPDFLALKASNRSASVATLCSLALALLELRLAIASSLQV